MKKITKPEFPKLKRKSYIAITAISVFAVQCMIAAILIAALIFPMGISVDASRYLSVNTQLNPCPETEQQAVNLQIEQTQSTGTPSGIYEIVPGTLFEIYFDESDLKATVGNAANTSEFQPHVIFTKDRGNVSLELSTNQYTPTTASIIGSGEGDKIYFPQSWYDMYFYVNQDTMQLEFETVLKDTPSQTNIDFNCIVSNMTMIKILPLDEEWDQSSCELEFLQNWIDDTYGEGYEGPYNTDFVITQTEILSPEDDLDIRTQLLYRPPEKVNSYEATAIDNNYDTKDVGNNITYSKVSRTVLSIPRGQMTDQLNESAWIEDIQYNEQQNEITFVLPRTWLRDKDRVYPIRHATGLDPSYTEDLDEVGAGFTEGAWTNWDAGTAWGVSADDVLEVILSNDDAGKEYLAGVREYDSTLDRYVDLHEAEGGGRTTCRMFVTAKDNSGTVEIDYYSEENTDVLFTLVGIWQNVGWTERWDDDTPSTGGSWQADETLTASGAASRVCHMILINNEADTNNTLGVRSTSSSDERKVLVHEQEAGGSSAIDMIVKADASYQIDMYTSDTTNTLIYNAGYFGSELDFVEDFQDISEGAAGSWTVVDMSAHLDQDGRVCDFLLAHEVTNSTEFMGVRNGDDSTTNRYFEEHESEDNGTNTSEESGFGISALTNSSGEIYVYVGHINDCHSRFMGYFKPSATEYWITPASNNSRIADDSESWEAACDTDVTGWLTTDEFIITLTAQWKGASSQDTTFRLQWMDVTDVSSWTDLATSGELKRGDATTLVHCTSPAGTLSGCRTTNDSHEVENNYEALVSASATDDYIEMQYAVDPASADASHEYAFRLYDTTDTNYLTEGDATLSIASGCSPDISETQPSYDFSTVAESATPASGLTYFTVTNNSGGAVTITIRSTDMTGGTTWTLSDTATPGADQYGLKAGLDGGDYTIIVKKNSPYNNLVSGLADSGTQDWGLKLWAPTSFSDGNEKTGTVTLEATCD